MTEVIIMLFAENVMNSERGLSRFALSSKNQCCLELEDT